MANAGAGVGQGARAACACGHGWQEHGQGGYEGFGCYGVSEPRDVLRALARCGCTMYRLRLSADLLALGVGRCAAASDGCIGPDGHHAGHRDARGRVWANSSPAAVAAAAEPVSVDPALAAAPAAKAEDEACGDELPAEVVELCKSFAREVALRCWYRAAEPAAAAAVAQFSPLDALLAACGWQGGTVWQVVEEIKRLRESESRRISPDRATTLTEVRAKLEQMRGEWDHLNSAEQALRAARVMVEGMLAVKVPRRDIAQVALDVNACIQLLRQRGGLTRRWRHKASGKVVEECGLTLLERSAEVAVLYFEEPRPCSGGTTLPPWAREWREWFERFEPVPPTAAASFDPVSKTLDP